MLSVRFHLHICLPEGSEPVAWCVAARVSWRAKFVWGLLGYTSILDRDYPVFLGILVLSAFLMLLGNLLSDVCVALVDPRVKFK